MYSMVRRLRALLALSLVPAGLLLASPGVVLADCMPPAAIENAVQSADIVFVGTVTDATNRNSWAEVTVEEVWRGPDQAQVLLIKGGPGANAATPVDRAFEVGVKYIFFPYVDPENGLSDNSCTSTQPWAEGFERLRPADARAPLASTATANQGFDLDSLMPVVLVAVVFVVLLGVGLIARGRQDA